MLVELANKEARRTRDQPEFHRLALMYLSLYQRNLEEFTQKYDRDLLAALVSLRDAGHIDLITTSATHAFMPVLEAFPSGLRAQIKTAVDFHTETFGKRPRGFWLPECGYFPGLEDYLDEQKLRYFFVESHGIAFADKLPKYGVFAPVQCPNGVFAFGRDPETSKAVWSKEEGYPGDISYRDFYRDIGFDLPLEDIGRYIIDGKVRVNTGFKYYAITGRGDNKAPYNRQEAMKKVAEHADNFVYRQSKQVERISALTDRRPLILAPFDAELFGHWWFEGPEFLEAVIQRIADTDWLEMITPEDYLELQQESQIATPSFSSWGNNGYASFWLNGSNDWIYRHVHKSVERMSELSRRFSRCDGMRRRILNQAAREVILMQASDWAFFMKNGTHVPYAERRVREHINNFTRIYEGMLGNNINLEWINALEKKNNLFPDIDYAVFA
jgi:1,4-alpha-glucan branching enzyme